MSRDNLLIGQVIQAVKIEPEIKYQDGWLCLVVVHLPATNETKTELAVGKKLGKKYKFLGFTKSGREKLFAQLTPVHQAQMLKVFETMQNSLDNMPKIMLN